MSDHMTAQLASLDSSWKKTKKKLNVKIIIHMLRSVWEDRCKERDSTANSNSGVVVISYMKLACVAIDQWVS